MAITVSGLALAPVKGTRIQTVERIELTPGGARGDRVFYVIDERERMRNGKQIGELQQISARYELQDQVLSLEFPDGRRATAAVQYGEVLTTRYFSAELEARLVLGPFSEALSEFVGQPLRLVAPDIIALDRGPDGAASLISRASVARLAGQARSQDLDARRFRMLIEVDGVEAHAEDGWVGRRVRVGEALVQVRGNVGRCLVTSRDPESGEIDLPTLDLLGEYRREVSSTEPLPFGVHAAVLEPGAVAVGDPVRPAD